MDERLIWLAGFMDGEGSFTLWFSRYKKKEVPDAKYRKTHFSEPIRFHPLITVAGTDYLSMVEIHELLTELSIKHYWQYQKKASKLSDKELWRVRVHSVEPALRLCDLLIPYLKGKKAQAIALKEWLHLRATIGSHAPYTRELIDKADAIRKAIPSQAESTLSEGVETTGGV